MQKHMYCVWRINRVHLLRDVVSALLTWDDVSYKIIMLFAQGARTWSRGCDFYYSISGVRVCVYTQSICQTNYVPLNKQLDLFQNFNLDLLAFCIYVFLCGKLSQRKYPMVVFLLWYGKSEVIQAKDSTTWWATPLRKQWTAIDCKLHQTE
jgi:hypothetical protein